MRQSVATIQINIKISIADGLKSETLFLTVFISVAQTKFQTQTKGRPGALGDFKILDLGL
jgi:hypothetical protein